MTTGTDRGPATTVGLRQRMTGPVLAALATVAAFVVVGTVSPYQQGHYPTCPTYALLGLYCPACGGLRAGHDLAHLDLAAAWGMNPLVVLAVPLAVGAWVVWVWRAASGRPREPVPQRARNRAWIGLAVVLVVFTVLRNVTALAPWLAPG